MEPSDRRRRANEEAAEWWLQLQAKEMPRDRREAFVDWLRESPVHVAEMLRVASVHGALEQFENWARIATQGEDEQVVVALHESDGPALDRPRRLRRAWPIAAAVAGLALATVLLLPALRGQVMATERGERREVVLADGSVVQIDPESRLRVRFEEHTRRVVLDAGRALFHVARNPDRPFLVEAASTTIRAVGTAFGVERREQGVIVTVSEGKVAIESKNQDLAPAFLTANEQVAVASGGAAAAPIRKVDSARALAWAEGRLNFENTPIREVVAQFNRYNNMQLRVEDEELASRPISGVFNAANPQSFIDFVEATTTVQIRRDSDGNVAIASAR